MDERQFDELYQRMVAEENKIGQTKAKEYSRSGDRLDNFKRLGKELDLDPKKVLWVYLKKHLDSIASYIRSGMVLSEPIEDRIKDARVYLALLRGLVEEDKGAKKKVSLSLSDLKGLKTGRM
jgi:hypothetical protein